MSFTVRDNSRVSRRRRQCDAVYCQLRFSRRALPHEIRSFSASHTPARRCVASNRAVPALQKSILRLVLAL